MFSLLADNAYPEIIRSVMAGGSAAVTSYFWFVRSRRESPRLEMYQLGNFRASLRRKEGAENIKRLCLSQIDTGGVLIANNSTRQNSILRFDCYLEHHGNRIKGDWGYTGEDKPPWNVGPETTIAFSPACFFEVPEDYEVPDDLEFRVELVTVSGKRFGETMALKTPQS